ncbi:DUF551 domain-containing protein [Klebsiella aerogenes]|uniref:DUF551 domain-containing protein n=1 Tax=Klebsiella aerogenes TaxID=548 RepID=UPI002DBAF592|nr:DUF551 domain-containing protein [Klebsiella aerogenes]MEB7619110.1 DUF551 domain-containing protein [Klebsiella aerogenes]
MTKSTITKTDIQMILDDDWLLMDDCEGLKNSDMVKMLARIALAAMDGEPYGFTDGDRRGMIYKPEHADRLNEPLPLYRHAQPAPVVMDDEKLRALFDAWFASDCSFDQSPEASEADNIAWRESYWYVWQRCRAAMFQAGNSPVIPDTWIPVSERMPENDVSVLTFDGMYKRVHHAMYGHWQCWEPGKITHWMPLPAAPQEVIGIDLANGKDASVEVVIENGKVISHG